jgi:hypothetical protein
MTRQTQPLVNLEALAAPIDQAVPPKTRRSLAEARPGLGCETTSLIAHQFGSTTPSTGQRIRKRSRVMPGPLAAYDSQARAALRWTL